MRRKYFGDSYDIVKKSLIAWLSHFGTWVTHPIFTEEFKPEDAAAFSRLLHTPLLSVEVLTPQINREEYFSSCRKAGHLFLDPDTGVRLDRCYGKKSEKFVFGPELVEWCGHRPKALTLIFDQSYSREFKKEVLLQKKLKYFADNNISGSLMILMATFLLLSADAGLIEGARREVIVRSALPEFRLVRLVDLSG